MNQYNFHNAHLKVKWAKCHINNLKLCVEQFILSDFYTFGAKKDFYTGQNIVYFEQFKSIKDKIALIVGDSIHNLRAAIDYVAWEIFKGTTINEKYIKFPFDEKRKCLEDSLNGAIKKGASKKVCDFILNTIKPYDGGNIPLWGLHKLDITNKHRFLIRIVDIPYLPNVCVEDDREQKHGNITIRPGESLRALFTSNNLHIKSHGKPTVDIIFNGTDVFEGEHVIPTLDKLAVTVDSTISLFEAL